MINEERIILMTRMASYEEHEGKRNMSIGKYFRGDYISLQIMKALVYVTIAFIFVVGLYVLYDFENFMTNIYDMDLFAFGKKILESYVITLCSYGLITYIVYAVRYHKAKKNLKLYYGNLKRLSQLYEKERKKQ